MIAAAFGVACGLVTAVTHAVAYVLSRRFIVGQHSDPRGLLVISHSMMGPAAATTLPFLMCPQMPGVDAYFWPLMGSAGLYLIGQLGFMLALRRTEASRLSPLMGLKVVAVAILSTLVFGTHLNAGQWIAVVFSVLGALLLNTWGGRMPRLAIAAGLFASLCFGVCDLFIRKLLDALQPMGPIRGPLTAAVMTYVVAGLICMLFLPKFGSRRLEVWRAAVPYCTFWLTGILCMFVCYAYAGLVLGNIVIGLRGLFSIGLGVLLARAGHHHLELHVSRTVMIRRVISAGLMLAAVALYAYESQAAQ